MRSSKTPSLSSLTSWNFFPLPLLNPCLLWSLLPSLLFEPLLHTALKWFSWPHFWHFLPYARTIAFIVGLTTIFAVPVLYYWICLCLGSYHGTFVYLYFEWNHRSVDVLMPKSFRCSILDSIFHDSNRHFSGVSSTRISLKRWSLISFIDKPNMYWSFNSSSCTLSGYLHSTID